MKLPQFDDFVRLYARNELKAFVRNMTTCDYCAGRGGAHFIASPTDNPCPFCLGYCVELPHDNTHICRDCGGWKGVREIGDNQKSPDNADNAPRRRVSCSSCRGLAIYPVNDLSLLARYADTAPMP